MTVSSNTNRVTYAGNGSTATFGFSFYISSLSDLTVQIRNNTTGVITTLMFADDYTVSGTAVNGTYPNGGSVFISNVPAAGTTVVIVRTPSLLQTSHWVDNDPDPAAVKEAAFDKLAIGTQANSEQISRSIRLRTGYTPTFSALLPEVITPNYGLAINSAGDGLQLVPIATSASGTVTSVGISMPADFSINNSPVTTAGNLQISWANQPANRVLAGPTSGFSSTPTFRALVAADMPAFALTTLTSGAATNGQVATSNGSGGITWTSLAGTGTVTSVGLTSPSFLTTSGSPITGSGSLTLSLATQAANTIFAGPSSGGGAQPTFRSIAGTDLPVMGGATNSTAGAKGAVPAPSAGDQVNFLRGDGAWATVTTATVSSVALSAPAEFAVSNSPITTTGTLTLTKATQAANTVWAGPTSGVPTAPAFRALQPVDLPLMVGATSVASGTAGLVTAPTAGQQLNFLRGDGAWSTIGSGTGTVTSVGLSLPAELTVTNSPVTTTGTLTGAWATQTANTFFGGATSGGAATPAFRTLVAADIPAVSLTTKVSGVLPIANGGTNATSASAAFDGLSPNTTLGDLIYGSGTNTNSRLAGSVAAAKRFLTQTGNGTISAIPAWAAIVVGDLPTITLNGDVAGAAAGGTITTTIGANKVLNSMLNTMTALTLKGNNTGSTGAAADLTVSQVNTMLGSLSNPMSAVGDVIYGGTAGAATRLPGQTTTAKQYLSQTGNGSISAVPAWATIAFADLSGSVAASQMPAHTGDVTTSAGSVATTVAAIKGTAVSSTTGTGNVVFSAAPTLTGVMNCADIISTGTGATYFTTSGTNNAGGFKNSTTSTAGDSAAPLYVQKGSTTNTTSQVLIEFVINNGATLSGRVTANGASSATFTTASDERLKENISALPAQLPNVLALRPVEFDYRDGSGHQIGFIAQEMQRVYPDAVHAGDDGMLSVGGWDKTTSRLVKAMQELASQNASLSSRISALEAKDSV